MKGAMAIAWVFLASNVCAQIDRSGNVLDDGGGSGDGIKAVLIGIAIGSIIGMVWAKYKQSEGKDFATGGGAVIGGLVGMFAWPLISILAK